MTTQQQLAIAVRIFERRRALGITQAEAGKRMGVTPSVWADMEAGRRRPLVATLRRAAAALGCTVGELIGE